MKNDNKKKVKISLAISGKKMLALLAVLILWAASLIFVWFYATKGLGAGSELIAARLYPYLNPRLRNLSQEERSLRVFASLIPLREKLMPHLSSQEENAAFYVEDLNTGAWIGLKEKEEFIPASLLKIPVAIGVMKKIDSNEWSLDTKFKVEEKYKDNNFGDLWKKENGTEITVEELIKQMLQESDNTATNILFDHLSAEERDNVYYHIGISNPEAPGEQTPNHLLFNNLTPRNLATFFRALYNATYLTRDSSNYLLKILTETKFDQEVKYSIPEHIKVAHKIAAFYDKGLMSKKNYHDCGIAFIPNHPYLYCYLTRDLEPSEAQNLILGMGEITYNYFNSEEKK